MKLWPGFLVAGEMQRQVERRVAKAAEAEGVLKFLLPKLPKIIFIPFSITLSPCVFWSQHDFPLLLSPYSRWWRHTGRKSVLALARSNATIRKRLHFWGWSFSRRLYLADVMLRSSSALPFFLFFFRTRIAGICVRLLLLPPILQ